MKQLFYYMYINTFNITIQKYKYHFLQGWKIGVFGNFIN